MDNYVFKINEALYPRWCYTGGWISPKVSEDGKEVTLFGYTDPDKLESEIIIRKVKDSLGIKPIIYWQRLGTSTPILLEQLATEQKQAVSSPLKSQLNKSTEVKLEQLATEQKQAVSSSSKSESAKNEHTREMGQIFSRLRKEAEIKAAQDIQAVASFAEDTKKAVENKVVQDIQAVVRFAEDINRKAAENSQAATRSLEDTNKQVRQWFDQAVQGTGQVVVSLQQTIIDFWNHELLELLLDIISRGIDLDKARDEVIDLQLDYPDEKPIQIADRIIRKKAVYATAIGLISGIVPGVALVVDLVKTLPLLVEMVYQIAVSYGFGDLTIPAGRGEILAIFGLALGSDKIAQLGLGFLVKHTPIPSWAIDASTNLIMFQLIGFAASQFYEAEKKAKVSPLVSKKVFTLLEEEVKAYFKKIISLKQTIHGVVDDAFSIKKQLLAIS